MQLDSVPTGVGGARLRAYNVLLTSLFRPRTVVLPLARAPRHARNPGLIL